jgi:hypothetical protein
MSTTSVASSGEFEFSESHNQLIGSLARKMALVGIVMIFFGILQMVNGITSLFMSRNPDRVIAAAQKAGLPEEQLNLLKEAFSGGFWTSPIAISSLAFALAGLLLFLVGMWTRQAAGGFAGVAYTKGNDISRLMDALRALHLKYGLMYTILLVAALISLISLLISLWHAWRGGA